MLPQCGTLALSFFIAARLWMLHFKMHRVITRGNDVLLVLNMGLAVRGRPDSIQRRRAKHLSAFPAKRFYLRRECPIDAQAMDVAIWRYARTRPHFLAMGTPLSIPSG
jgi:hypothetical protein